MGNMPNSGVKFTKVGTGPNIQNHIHINLEIWTLHRRGVKSEMKMISGSIHICIYSRLNNHLTKDVHVIIPGSRNMFLYYTMGCVDKVKETEKRKLY